MTGVEPLWLPGFFTGRRHAVVNLAGWTDFHGMLLGWSVCNRSVVLHPDMATLPSSDPVCPSCARWFNRTRGPH